MFEVGAKAAYLYRILVPVAKCSNEVMSLSSVRLGVPVMEYKIVILSRCMPCSHTPALWADSPTFHPEHPEGTWPHSVLKAHRWPTISAITCLKSALKLPDCTLYWCQWQNVVTPWFSVRLVVPVREYKIVILYRCMPCSHTPALWADSSTPHPEHLRGTWPLSVLKAYNCSTASAIPCLKLAPKLPVCTLYWCQWQSVVISWSSVRLVVP